MTIIGGATNATVTVAAGTNPQNVAVNPVTHRIYVPNFNSANVTVIDESTGVPSTVNAGTNPSAVAVNPVTDKIYVANQGSNNVTAIDGATNATATVNVGTAPEAIAVNPVTDTAYVANFNSNNVTVIDGAANSVVATVPAGTNPLSIAVDPVTNQIYVANTGSNNVTAIDGATNNVVATVGAGTQPDAIAVNSASDEIFVANSGSNNATVIAGATNTVVATVDTGADPIAVAVNPATNRIYVVNVMSDNVTKIDGATNTVATTISAGNQPEGIAINPATNQIYVFNGADDTVTAIDGATNSASPVAVGAAPNGVAVDRFTGEIAVPNAGSNNATLIFPAATNTLPLTTAITPVSDSQTLATAPVFRTTSTTPSFTLTATSSYTTTGVYSGLSANNPPPTAIYYQLDTWEGTWIPATMTSAAGTNPGTFSVTLPTAQSLGKHILYAYAVYGDEGTPESDDSGTGNSPEIGNIAALLFNVEPQATATALTTDAPLVNGVYTVTAGSPVTVTANVTASVSGAGVHTGQLVFIEGEDPTPLAIVNLANGDSFQTSSLVVGTREIFVQYVPEGAPQYLGSFSTVTLNVVSGSKAATTTTLHVSATTVASGDPFTATATVADSAGSGVPTGTVTFMANGVKVGTIPLVAGVATLSYAHLPAHLPPSVVITASYSGDANSLASNSSSITVTTTASKAATTTTLMASATTVARGGSITFKAKVADTSGSNVPTGAITFIANGVSVSTVPLSNGLATLTIPSVPANAPNTVTVVASYAGDANSRASMSSPVTVTVTN